MKPIILHISNDYPDALQSRKTRAVQSLVDGTPEYRHVVYSLNRTTALGGIASLPFGQDRIAVAYGALPKGLFWEKRLDAVADWIAQDLDKRGIKPDLVEAHKLTVEGLIGQRLATYFGCPLVCDIQGNTDAKILRRKPSLRPRFRQIVESCRAVFPYAPWAIKPFVAGVGLDVEKCFCLPVILDDDAMGPSAVISKPHFITAFDVERWKDKNLPGLLAAIVRLRPQMPDIRLDVYGGCSPRTLLTLKRCIAKMGIEDCVRLMGPAPNAELRRRMRDCVAFVMPSLFESYGMVFVEALFAGIPIMCPKDRAIDGYLDMKEVGLTVDPTSIDDIAQGMTYLHENERSLKERIARMQVEGRFNFFTRSAILDLYRETLNNVLTREP